MSAPGLVSLRNSTPLVQNISAQSALALVSSLIWYPTLPAPMFSPLSLATRSLTVTADIRLGCVHMIVAPLPLPHASSMRYWGTCVVLPHPVAPATSTTWLRATASKI